MIKEAIIKIVTKQDLSFEEAKTVMNGLTAVDFRDEDHGEILFTSGT